MSRSEPTLDHLPTEAELFWAPERAALAALDASLILSIRALKVAHYSHDDPDDSTTVQPILLLADSILASARSLHELLEGYQALVDRTTRSVCGPRSCDCTEPDIDF